MDRMHRLLMQVLMEPHHGGESLLGTIRTAVLPIAKVFTMCFMGFLMASKYVNILTANGRKLLNGVSTQAYSAAQKAPAAARSVASEVKSAGVVETASELAKTVYTKYEPAQA